MVRRKIRKEFEGEWFYAGERMVYSRTVGVSNIKIRVHLKKRIMTVFHSTIFLDNLELLELSIILEYLILGINLGFFCLFGKSGTSRMLCII